MDWNWFFSSVAQSIAALVGIMAAFVITKIVSNQAEFARKAERGRDLLARSRELVDRLGARYFRWYSKHQLESALDSVEYGAKRQGAPEDPAELYQMFNFPRFVPRSKVLREIESRVRTAKEPEFGRALDSIAGASLKAGLRPRLDEERERIEDLIAEARHQIRLVAQWLA